SPMMTVFFPSMSPRRPAMGVLTAPARSEAVTAHVNAAGVVFSCGGSTVSSGAMSDCIIATSVQTTASRPIVRVGEFCTGAVAVAPARRVPVVDEAAAARMELQSSRDCMMQIDCSIQTSGPRRKPDDPSGCARSSSTQHCHNGRMEGRGMQDEVLESLVREQMLLTRFALQNVAPKNREVRLDRSAVILLSRLRMQGPMSVAELADAFDVDVSTIHRQTTAAMKAKLLERIPDPDGGVARKLRPTEQGMHRLN